MVSLEGGQVQYNKQPKQVYNMLFVRVAGRSNLTAVLDHKTGNVLNKPKEVIQQVHKYCQHQATPAFGPKTGSSLTTQVNKN